VSAPQPRTQPERWLKPREAARYAGVDPRTLVVWTRTRGLASEKTAGGHRRYPQHGLDAVLDALRRGERPWAS
jgi:DNA-binding transcriptional MerR regulator